MLTEKEELLSSVYTPWSQIDVVDTVTWSVQPHETQTQAQDEDRQRALVTRQVARWAYTHRSSQKCWKKNKQQKT